MKKGSAVHKKLELEVHELIPIDVETKEDSWGLRLWNVIQGLRALRVTGMTRELSVWGVIDGQVISGIIDELSYACPDPDLEYALDESSKVSVEDSGIFLESSQRTIDEFFSSQNAISSQNPKRKRKIYITDTKTRATPNVPGGSSVRPTMMQLMLYRHLLCLLSTNQVPSQTIFAKYKLDGQEPFSQIFLSQIASLELNFDSNISASSETDHPSTQFSTAVVTIGELEGHTNLNDLWNLMMREYQRTLSPAILSPILNASYRYQLTGRILGSKSFVYDDDILRSFVVDELDFWRGNREPRGVEIEDAFKCGTCEFAQNCEWRIEKHRAMIRPNERPSIRSRIRSKVRPSVEKSRQPSSSPAFETPPPRRQKDDTSETSKNGMGGT
jgi:exonuclease V